MNVLLSFRGSFSAKGFSSRDVVFRKEDLSLEAVWVMKQHPSQISMQGPIPQLTLVKSKPTLGFGVGQDIPTKEIELLFLDTATHIKSL